MKEEEKIIILEETFKNLVLKYTDDLELIYILWKEIEKKYSKRAYHNLNHLNDMLIELIDVKDQIKDWDTILFSLYYHDIIYSTKKSDNEVKSSELAKERLQQISYPDEKIKDVEKHILATVKHLESDNNDTNLFLDTDLSSLGREWKIYDKYSKSIRKEYFIYSKKKYNKGRTKILRKFLDMKSIFKTEHFYKKYEAQARKNILKDLYN